MKIAIMQPYLFPYIGYWQLINAVDKFVILDDVNFINRGWINRNRILVNMEPQLITIPLIEASQNKLIQEIDIVSDYKWKDKLLKTIQFNYKKAPFYKEVYPLLEAIILCSEQKISLHIYQSIKLLGKYMGVITNIEPSSSKYQNRHLKGSDKIIDICIQEKAQTYINPIGGVELYDKKVFDSHKIQLLFIDTQVIIYPQFGNNFTSNLSIIDVLMFNSIEEIKNMLTKYDLI